MTTEYLVLSALGTDRPGIVDQLAKAAAASGCNIEDSRMTVLGGEFAVLMLVSLPEGRSADLDEGLGGLAGRGYKVTATPADRTYAEAHPGWLPYRIEVHGADHEGIIHEVASYLSRRGISIESMESECTPAPTSGVPLFAMTAEVVVPPGLADQGWEEGLDEIGRRLNLEIAATSAGNA